MEGASSQVSDVVVSLLKKRIKTEIKNHFFPSVTIVRFVTSSTDVIKQKYSSILCLGLVGKEKSH